MEKIFELLYNKSIKLRSINIDDMNSILSILIDNKDLKDYILCLEVKKIRSNKLASYSTLNKSIIIYSNIIEKMQIDIYNNLIIDNDIYKNLYVNFRILQVIMHEVEHANQIKNVNKNSLESFILRISNLVNEKKQLYEFSPFERFAEINSFKDIVQIVSENTSNKNFGHLIENDLLQRNLIGYHYINNRVIPPIVSYYSNGEKEYLLLSFDWYSRDYDETINNSIEKYSLDERLFYGFPISSFEYYWNMNSLINRMNNNFKNNIKVLKL